MTNHVNELMKAAGVKQYKRTYFECKGGRSTICLCPQIGVPNAWCKDECGEMQEKVEYFYPAFTPAKQLELVKLVLKKPYIEWEQYFENNKFIMKADMPDETYACLTIDVENTEYALALAEFITELLKIKRLDKSEVRRILEDD